MKFIPNLNQVMISAGGSCKDWRKASGIIDNFIVSYITTEKSLSSVFRIWIEGIGAYSNQSSEFQQASTDNTLGVCLRKAPYLELYLVRRTFGNIIDM